MPIAVSCKCGAKFKAPDSAAGRRAACSECGQPIVIPAATASPASKAPAKPVETVERAPSAKTEIVLAHPEPATETEQPKRSMASVAIMVYLASVPVIRWTFSTLTRKRPAKLKRLPLDDGFYPDCDAPRPAIVPAQAGSKACPFCGETVLAVAKICKHCGQTIDVVLRAVEESRRAAELHALHQHAPPAYVPAAPSIVNVSVDQSIRHKQSVNVKGGGSAWSVFWGLFLFFVVMPVVLMLGCVACGLGIGGGVVAHQAAGHPQTPATPGGQGAMPSAAGAAVARRGCAFHARRGCRSGTVSKRDRSWAAAPRLAAPCLAEPSVALIGLSGPLLGRQVIRCRKKPRLGLPCIAPPGLAMPSPALNCVN